MQKRVLILCTGNSCRSQMAEGLWNHLGGGHWLAQSAGSHPSGRVHPMAIEAMQQIQLDIEHHKSKHVHGFEDQEFDLVITVCDRAAETCPVLPGARNTLHWPFADPDAAQGTPEQRLSAFIQVRDQIKARIATYLRDCNTTS